MDGSLVPCECHSECVTKESYKLRCQELRNQTLCSTVSQFPSHSNLPVFQSNFRWMALFSGTLGQTMDRLLMSKKLGPGGLYQSGCLASILGQCSCLERGLQPVGSAFPQAVPMAGVPMCSETDGGAAWRGFLKDVVFMPPDKSGRQSGWNPASSRDTQKPGKTTQSLFSMLLYFRHNILIVSTYDESEAYALISP